MAFWSIGLPDESTPYVTQSVEMSGRTYVFTIDWNSRSNRWTVGLADIEGTRIIDGMLLCIGVDLLRTIPSTLDHVPPGSLFLNGPDDPDFGTMNAVTLYYYEADA